MKLLGGGGYRGAASQEEGLRSLHGSGARWRSSQPMDRRPGRGNTCEIIEQKTILFSNVPFGTPHPKMQLKIYYPQMDGKNCYYNLEFCFELEKNRRQQATHRYDLTHTESHHVCMGLDSSTD